MANLRGQWTDNPKLERWEARIDGRLAIARYDRVTRRYVAYIDSEDERATDHYAPASFSDPDTARAWCEAEVERLNAEQRPEGGIARQIGQLLKKPDPEL